MSGMSHAVFASPPSLPRKPIVTSPAVRAVLECAEDVGAVATGGEADQYIPGPAQGFDLAAEDVFVSEVVGRARQHADIEQRDRGQRPAIAFVAGDELFGEVDRVGRAAAIAGQQDLAARLPRVDHRIGNLLHRRRKRF